MAYLLGNWATDRQATAIAGRLGTADLYQACLIFHRRLVGVAVNRLVGMALNNISRPSIICHTDQLFFLRDWSLIRGRGGLQNGKIAGPKLFAPPLKTG